ncbi:class I SAM-dependent methyltransferase [Nocardioides bruguierae]|uniref:Class I SAM-dependent methyltransferase n=1 Tax=Nocardioides bruguierae TaxID=2945102 RepID=A0A9X2D927_9ACTN|nr:class I SAM-dependent methyltransferase [Nocardioides bruguierae]MCM0621289.1 class I SAM-dependent methyltransferase [Nocardioides bruguierae]
MDDLPEYARVNRDSWDDRAAAHAASPDYALDRLLADPTAVSDVVAFDRARLGDLTGLRGVHLQCHIGTDTLSLHRLGARMTGLDLSGASLAQARDLAARAGAEIEYVESEVHAAGAVLEPASFDLVYTGIGALCWLPDVAAWARVVAGLLAPGGRLFLREGHPMLWALDDERADDLLVARYPYFETAEPLVFSDAGTYVETDHVFTASTTHEWNHGLGEIVQGLLDAGLTLTSLAEHDSVPWNALPGAMEPVGGGEFALREGRDRLAASYTLTAVKR